MNLLEFPSRNSLHRVRANRPLRLLRVDEEVAFFSTQLGETLRIGSRLCAECQKLYNCAACGKRPNRGRSEKITSEEDVVNFSQRLGIRLIIGALLCDRCRRLQISGNGGQELGAVAGAEAFVDQGGIEEESTSVEEDPDADPPFAAHGVPADRPVIYPVPRTAATHRWCIFCKTLEDLHVIGLTIRRNVFNRARLYIPEGCRTCSNHSIDFQTPVDVLRTLKTCDDKSNMPEWEVKFFVSDSTRTRLWDDVYRMNLDDQRLKSLVGLEKGAFVDLVNRLTSLRNTAVRNVYQAVFIFLLNLKTGDSDELIAAYFNFPHSKIISDIRQNVIGAFENVLEGEFGPQSVSRRKLLDNTSPSARRILNL